MTFHFQLNLRDFLLVLVVILTWGFHVPVIKLGVTLVDPFALNFVRFIATGLILLPFAKKISLDDLKKLLPVSLLFVGANLMFTYLSLSYITSNSFVMLVQVAQPFTLILAWVFFGERFGVITTTGIALALCGLLVVFGAPDILSAPQGALYGVLAAFFWSVGSLAMKRTGHIPPATFISYAYLISVPIALAGTLIFEDNQIARFIEADPYQLSFVIAYQVLLMALMTFVWSGLMARNPAQFVTPFLMLQPIIAVIGSYLLLGETLAIEVLLGGVLVLFGIGIINMQKIKKSQPHEDIPPPLRDAQ